MTEDDSFAPIRTGRLLDTLVSCPHCRGVVDVTLETQRARVEIISLLWDAFWERGRAIEADLDVLRVELENQIVRRERGTEPLAAFHDKTLCSPAKPKRQDEKQEQGGAAE